jgi:hypothetical protein
MEPDFAIWEDPTYRQSPLRLPPMSYPDAGEEKENTYATVSDYDTSDGEESERQRIDWARVQVGPHDVFGLPVDSPFGPVLADLPVGRHAGDTFSRAVPTATERNVQPQMRVMMLDEGEEEDWDDSLSMAQIRELQGLENVFMRGAEHRIYHDRHLPMRDANVQGQANIFLEARRVTEHQRHQDRHPHAMEED